MAQGYQGVPAGPLSAWLSVREGNRQASLQELQAALQAQAQMAARELDPLKKQFLEAQIQETLAQAEQRRNPVEKPVAIGSGGLRLPGGEIVPPAARPVPPASPAPFTLAPGATRYSPEGQPIASAPATPREPPAPPAPIVQTDQFGNTVLYDRDGNVIKKLGQTGKPSAQIMNDQLAKAKMQRDLAGIIPTLTEISKDGGLLDQATGSGIGAGIDIAASMFGYGTPGAIAIGRLKPATDAVLKLVPRFEGPQSDKDTKMYQDAAGNLANPSTPNSVKKEAAKTILKLYKQRQGQFVTKDYESATGGASQGGEWKDL